MSKGLVAALTFIASVWLIASLEEGVRQSYADAGYIVIGKQAYRITPVPRREPME